MVGVFSYLERKCHACIEADIHTLHTYISITIGDPNVRMYVCMYVCMYANSNKTN